MDSVSAQHMDAPASHATRARPRQKCVLIGWELGAGLGHVGMLRPLAEALRNDGHRVVLALRETVNTQRMLQNTDLEIRQAPVWAPPANGPEVDLRTLGDVLYASGFAEVARLRRQASAWTELVRAVDPHLVIGEYSPTLALAAMGVRPYVTVGSGFTVPPQVRPLPPFRFWEAEVSEQSITHEKAVQDATNAVRQALGLEPLPHWSELFGGDYVGVCTYPALDGYRAYRKHQALGPLSNRSVGRPTLERQRVGVFAYLSGLALDFSTIIDGIAQAGIATQAYVRDLQPGQRELLQAHGIQLHDTPRDLYEELPKSSAIVHHGGLSTTHVAIETGTPQVILPTITEQVITGQKIVDLKLGAGLSRGQRTVDSVAVALRRIVGNPRYQLQASQLADQALRHAGPSALSVLQSRCNALLARTDA